MSSGLFWCGGFIEGRGSGFLGFLTLWEGMEERERKKRGDERSVRTGLCDTVVLYGVCVSEDSDCAHANVVTRKLRAPSLNGRHVFTFLAGKLFGKPHFLFTF